MLIPRMDRDLFEIILKFKKKHKLKENVIQKEIQKFSGHTDSVLSLAHNKDSKRLYSGGEDGTLRIFGNFKFFFSPS